jgi:hypothetical protein
MSLTTGKIAEVMFEKTMESYEQQMQMLNLTDFHNPDPGRMQNAGNVVWYPVQQHAPVISGWDLTGQETGIIEETYPAILGTPTNDFVQQRVDDLRDKRFWENRGKVSGMRQATELNKAIASAVALQGSLFFRSNVTSGYEFIAEAQAMMNERQLYQSGSRAFVLNDRDTLLFSKDLAARQTLQGKPNDTWAKGQIGQNVAEFDIYTGSFLPNLTGGADPATTVTGDQSFKPEAGSVVAATGVVTNIDYRIASVVVAASTNYNVGDKITFSNAAVTVKALALADKQSTGQAMTFTIVGKPDATHIQIYPKPIAANDPALTTLEAAYANIDTQILDTATVDRLNIDASNKVNIFWDKDAIEIIGGLIPAELFGQYDGMKVVTDTMSNGQQLYMVYDGNIATMNFRYRIFTWYGITVCAPQNCGVGVTY